jgi:hypothetical protein
MEVSSEYYARMFMQILREHSQNKQDPVSEWKLLDSVSYMQDGGFCICTKDIKNIFVIQNNVTQELLNIGGDCAKRWLDPSMQCHKCNIPLGNVLERRKQQKFLCKTCLRKAGKMESTIIVYDSTFMIYFDLAQNTAAIEYLLNKKSTSANEKKFLDYCSYFYEVV